jgi:hypothetical protein
MFRRYDFPGASEVINILLSVRSEDTLQSDMKYLLHIGQDPECFTRSLDEFLKTPGIDRAGLLSEAWDSLLWNIFNPAFGDGCRWIPGLRCLVEQGVDIHQPGNDHDKSAYMRIMDEANHPFEADHRAHSWLKIIKECGLDLGSYIKAETALIERTGFYPTPNGRQRKVIMLDFEGLQIPSWRWALPLESSILEVLEEFLNIGIEPSVSRDRELGSVRPAGPDDLEPWKAGSDTWWAELTFPFQLSPVDRIVGTNDVRLNRLWCRQTYTRAVEVRDKRFARRQAKKWGKAHPGGKLSPNQMPGSWVD